MSEPLCNRRFFRSKFSDDTFGCDKPASDLIHQQLGRHAFSSPCKSREECTQKELHRCASDGRPIAIRAADAADEIQRLQAENAALKQRLVIDDAMVERASHAICKVVNATFDGILGNANTLVLARAALEAALNGGE